MIVMQIKEVSQASQLAKFLGELCQSIMPEVKHTEMLQISDLGRNFSEVVIGQDEGFDFKTLEYFVRYQSEMLLPEVDIHAALMKHSAF